MSENKSCAKYLGVHVAERVLSRIFKNVHQMPTDNPGYDFVCNRGKKIDVKSSCRCYRQHKSDSWIFHIRQNRIAEYFLMLAFDDRESLNPEHIWLIPASKVNDKTGISISESRLDKWSDYEQPINHVVACCNTMRGTS